MVSTTRALPPSLAAIALLSACDPGGGGSAYVPPGTEAAASALAGFSAKLNSIAAPLRKSFTYDQGKEMSRHVDLAAQTGVKVYFCDPHSPWQRGTCENTNGLIRQYLPKGTDLSVFSQDELDGIADSLNTRPRATHNWHTPLEMFAQTLASSHKPSSSVH